MITWFACFSLTSKLNKRTMRQIWRNAPCKAKLLPVTIHSKLASILEQGEAATIFVVLNDKREIITWQLTATTAFDEIKSSLEKLRDTQISKVIVDNCCQVRVQYSQYFQGFKLSLIYFTRFKESRNPYQREQNCQNSYRRNSRARHLLFPQLASMESTFGNLLSTLKNYFPEEKRTALWTSSLVCEKPKRKRLMIVDRWQTPRNGRSHF